MPETKTPPIPMALPIPAAAQARPPSALPRVAWWPALVALAGAGAGLMLAAHYPIAPLVMVALFLAVAAFAYARPLAWPIVVPALLPLIGLAPWTGWITFEEFDLLILAVAFGGYARWAAQPVPAAAGSRGAAPLVWLMAALMAASVVISMLRGFDDAGGFVFGWFEGYREPMNSVRIAKSFFAALLVFPLWAAGNRMAPAKMVDHLALGLVIGLCGAALAALWERVAFPGLLNFNSDYRTTALFWEMHVGGAALDGWLALTVPFAVLELLRADTPRRWLWAGVVAIVAGYACMTTFSRGVYAAVPVGLAATFLLFHRQQAGGAPNASRRLARDALLTFVLALGFSFAADWMFPTSGYRGMLALLGAAVLLLPLAGALRRLRATAWIAGVLLGIVLAMVAGAAAWLLPKGGYVVYAAGFFLTAAALFVERQPRGRPMDRYAGLLALAGYVWVLAGVGMAASQWGGEPALARTLVPVAALAVVAVLGARVGVAAWPESLRWQGATAGAMVLAGMVIAAFGGGAYMTGRFATSTEDFDARLHHWEQAFGELKGPMDLVFGKGLGRFMDTYAMVAPANARPADYRLHADGDRPYLRLIAGTHVNGWGELLRVSQRVAPPVGPAVVQFDVRASGPRLVHVEVCQKHLLYDMGCLVKRIEVQSKPGQWQTVKATLDGEPLSRGAWYAPRLIAFAIATENSDQPTDLDAISLAGTDGRNLLANGDFSDGMARWFFSSDRYHMPWHAKNMAVAIGFDQGLVGLALLALLLAGALWRVAFGHARGHPLAPAIAGGLLGFIAVGMFDSLLDVPRVAFAFYLLVLIGLTLRPARLPAGAAQPEPMPRSRRRGSARRAASAGAALFALHVSADAATQLIQVGPQRAVKTIAAAAALATDGATVEVDAGRYVGDVAVWNQSRLRLRAVGGRVLLAAAGQAAERKAIWVIRGDDVRVEGFDFTDARVPDRNGAGIRFERGSLRVTDCSFVGNEMGILTSNDPEAVLDVEDSEFAHNRRPDGHNHGLYAGTIKRLTVTGSYFHDGFRGHLLKSRAALNRIAYNRLDDGPDGRASYELEFPNGGTAYVIGNIIAQSAETENAQIVSFGAEGFHWPANALYLVHNTLVDGLPLGGVYLRVWPGPTEVHAIDNLVVGRGRWEAGAGADLRNNPAAERSDFDPAAPDAWRLKRSATAWGRASALAAANGEPLTPAREFAAPHRSVALDVPVRQPGAAQRPPDAKWP